MTLLFEDVGYEDISHKDVPGLSMLSVFAVSVWEDYTSGKSSGDTIYPFGHRDYGFWPNLGKFWIYQCFSCQRTNWSPSSLLPATTQQVGSSYLNKWSCDRFHGLAKEVGTCSKFCWLTQSSHWSAVQFAFCIIRQYQFWAENLLCQHPK